MKKTKKDKKFTNEAKILSLINKPFLISNQTKLYMGVAKNKREKEFLIKIMFQN